MIVKKFCFIFLKIIIISLSLINNTNQLTKCNRRLLNSFLLTGMRFSVYNQMTVCGNVHDKCCTIADEIKISKLWNFRVAPMLDTYGDEYMGYLRKIMMFYWQLMNIDPRLIILKYINIKKVPFQDEICQSQEKIETSAKKNEFITFNDKKIAFSMSKISSPNQKFNTSQVTHHRGKRHWGVKDPKNYHRRENWARRRREPISFSPAQIEYTSIQCSARMSYTTREFIIVNEVKSKFCLGLYDKFLNFDNRQFLRFLPTLKNTLTQVHKIKSTFYCAVCNAHAQRYFDLKKHTIGIDRGFCKRLLRGKKDYFNFVHILLIEYLDLVLQYVSCFETKGDEIGFPSQNFLIKYKRRIPFIKKCFHNLDNDDFMTHCWFICNKYKILRITPFFDGEIKMVKRVFLAVYSFLRKMDMSKRTKYKEPANFNTIGAVNGLLIEPLNPSHFLTKKYYGNKKERAEILGGDTRKNFPDYRIQDKLDKTLKRLGLGSVQDIKSNYKLHKKIKKKSKLYIKTLKAYKKHISVNKRKRLKKKMLPPYINKTSRLRDAFYEDKYLKKKKLIHSGYWPARALKKPRILKEEKTEEKTEVKKEEKSETTEPPVERKLGLVHTLKKGFKRITHHLRKIHKNVKKVHSRLKKIHRELKKKNQGKAPKPKKDPIIHLRIEPSSQLYIKNKNPIQASKFKIDFIEDGMKPLMHYNLINYDYDITQIISKHFKKKTKLNKSVVFQYLSIKPQKVNNFNHQISQYVSDYNSIPFIHDLKEINIRLAKALEKNDVVLAAKMRKQKRIIAHRVSLKNKFVKDQKMKKKILEGIKDAKLEKLRGHRVVIEHHVTKEHFESNFTGFKDLFIKLFGT